MQGGLFLDNICARVPCMKTKLITKCGTDASSVFYRHPNQATNDKTGVEAKRKTGSWVIGDPEFVREVLSSVEARRLRRRSLSRLQTDD